MTDVSTVDPAVAVKPHDDPRVARRAAQYRRWVAATTRPLDVLAVVFLVAFLAGRLVDEGPDWWQTVFTVISLLIWFAFAVDYVVRLSLSPERGTFVRTHKLDLLMVLLPMLRVLRVVLLLRKSIRSISMERIAGSLFTIVAVVVVTGAILEWKVEHNAPNATITTLGTAFWWAIVTTTTVGYGDTYPVTSVGRLIASVIMVVGIGLIGTVSATVAAWFVSHKQQQRDDELKAKKAARRRRLLALGKRGRAPEEPLPEAAAGARATAKATDADVGAAPLADAHPDPHSDADADQALAERADADLIDADLADADADATSAELVEAEASLADAVAALTAQIRELAAQQQALRSSIADLVDQRSG